MTRDSKLESQTKEDDFKNHLLIQNPELYQMLYGEDSNYIDEDEIEHLEPANEDEFKDLMKELRDFGVIT
jgi:hypothetical protein